MSCDIHEVGTRVRYITDFSIADNLAAPIAASHLENRSGDAGGVTQKRMASNFHWLIIRWDRLKHRTLTLEPPQFDFVRSITGEGHE